MVSQDVQIINRLGLHARAAAKLVDVAKAFEATIQLTRDGGAQADAKRIMSILVLEAPIGTQLKVTAEGTDEAAALEAVIELINDRFGEES